MDARAPQSPLRDRPRGRPRRGDALARRYPGAHGAPLSPALSVPALAEGVERDAEALQVPVHLRARRLELGGDRRDVAGVAREEPLEAGPAGPRCSAPRGGPTVRSPLRIGSGRWALDRLTPARAAAARRHCSSSRTLRGQSCGQQRGAASARGGRGPARRRCERSERRDRDPEVLGRSRSGGSSNAKPPRRAVEVVAEASRRDRAVEVCVRRGDDADVDRHRRRSLPRGVTSPLLEHAQERDLRPAAAARRSRRGAACRRRPRGRAGAVVARAGEGALRVAEELALDEVRRDGAAVDRDERAARGARAACTARASDLLAGAGLAAEQQRGPAARDQGELVEGARRARGAASPGPRRRRGPGVAVVHRR